MIQFAQLYPDEQIVVSLGRQLSWTHFRALLPLKSDAARRFYESQAVTHRLSVRELRHTIGRKAFERQEIADSQVAPGPSVPMDAFKDPYLLDFLGLRDSYFEALSAGCVCPRS